jgi:peptide deformylase
MVDIVQKGDAILRKVAKEVHIKDIGTPKIQAIIKKMKQAVSEQDDAVAVAAPQIGESLRIFVVSGKVFLPHYPDLLPTDTIPDDLVCINPEITKYSKEKQEMTEGCLSVRWLYGTMKRSAKASLRAYDENGKKFTRGGAGLISQIFQHELDHLNGILFIDNAKDLEDIPPEKQDKDDKSLKIHA